MDAGASSGSPKPSPWHFALACCLLKHKPDGIGVKEYLISLRKSISTTSSETFTSLDAVNYWKGLYQQAQFEIHQLQTRISSVHAGGNDDLFAPPEVATNKRKAARTLATPKKAVKTSSSSTATDLDGSRQLILYHLHAATQLIQKQQSSSSADLSNVISSHLVESVRLIQITLERFVSAWRAKKSNDNKLESHSILRAFSIVLHLLNNATKKKTQQQSFGHVVYMCTTLYQKVIENISSVCINGSPAVSATSDSPPKSSRQAKAGFLSALKTLALELVDLLDPTSVLHGQILEGIEYLIMERSGEVLYKLTFNHPRKSANEESTELEPTAFKATRLSASTKVAELEAEYLLPFLKSVIALASSFKANKSSSSSSTSLAKKLSQTTRFKLQEALIKCIWDENDGGKIKCFSRPEPPSAEDEAKARSLIENGADTEESFVQEVWKLMGWEILQQKHI